MSFPTRAFLFGLACISGGLFALVLIQYDQVSRVTQSLTTPVGELQESGYDTWFSHLGLQRNNKPLGENWTTEAEFLYNNIPVLCLVFTETSKHARAVSSTWTRHCNHAIIYGSINENEVPMLKVPLSSESESFCYAFQHFWDSLRGQFQWALLVDDRTFAIVENLRVYVAPLNASQPYYLGHAMQDYSGLYNTLNAGVGLSHGTMEILSQYFMGLDCATVDKSSVDKMLGRILQKVHSIPVDTRDYDQRGRFNPFSVEKMLIPGSISFFSSYWRNSLFLSPEGSGCCSEHAVTFHGIDPLQMHLMEYLIYRLHPGPFKPPPAPTSVPPVEYTETPFEITGKAMVHPFGLSRNNEENEIM